MSERYTVEYGEDARLVMIVNHDTKDAYTVFQACRELNRLAAEVATLRAACEAVVAWVVMATAGGDPTRHPKSIENAKADLRTLLTALNYPADQIEACCE